MTARLIHCTTVNLRGDYWLWWPDAPFGARGDYATKAAAIAAMASKPRDKEQMDAVTAAAKDCAAMPVVNAFSKKLSPEAKAKKRARRDAAMRKSIAKARAEMRAVRAAMRVRFDTTAPT